MKQYLIVTGLALIVFSSFVSTAHADWILDQSGTLVKIEGSVLGNDDEQEEEVEQEDETEQESHEDLDESSKKKLESEREDSKKRQEKELEILKKQAEARIKIKEKTGDNSQTEIRLEGQKLKIKQEIKDPSGKSLKKQEIELESGESLHIDQEDGEVIKIEAGEVDRLELLKNKIKTSTKLDLSIDDKNQISVSLPNGKTKELSLPDKALERLVSNGIIASLEDGTTQYQLVSGKNGDPVYEVEGVVQKKLFGLFKLDFAHKLEVAATSSDDGSVATGDVVETNSQETSPWRRLLERLSL